MIWIGIWSLAFVGCNNGNTTQRTPEENATKSANDQKKMSPRAEDGGVVLVEMRTSVGDVVIELDAEKAPVTVKNFLAYVDSQHYDGTIFHRVMSQFMIQGGGFKKGMMRMETRLPIRNEAKNGLSNVRGTLAMARTNAIHSATDQFFINVKDNVGLDYSSTSYGYAVFGRVVQGMDVVDKIRTVPTGRAGVYGDVPLQDVMIFSIRRR